MRSTIKLLVTLALIIMFASSASAWQGGIDFERMEKDLRISEDILKRLISDESSKEFFYESSVKGVYLDDHGVVFLVPMVNREYSDERAVRARENHKKFQDNLVDFLSTYAAVIKQVRPDDKITIVATPSHNISTNYYYAVALNYADASERREERFTPLPFIMSAKKSDIDRFRNGDLNQAQFKNTVSITEMGNGGDAYVSKDLLKAIKIMKTIFEISIEDQFKKTISSEYIQGTYIKDYGVIYTINTGSSISVPMPTIAAGTTIEGITMSVPKVGEAKAKVEIVYQAQVKQLENALKAQEVQLKAKMGKAVSRSDEAYSYLRAISDSQDKTTNEEYLQQLLDVFMEALAEYGHTLRGLDPAESVSILYNSRGYRMRIQGNQNLMLSAKYSDIQAFSRGSLSMEQFKDRVTARIY
ncbi:hypothetical protein ACFL6O_00470 [candidate division KSB1 bacterium]